MLQNAAQTSGQARQESQAQPVASDACAVDPGNVPFQAGIVKQIARFKVVGSVEDQVLFLNERRHRLRVHVRDSLHDLHGAIDLAQMPHRRDSLRQSLPGIGLGVERLALQVGLVHIVPVRQCEASDARAHQDLGKHRAEGAAPNEKHARTAQFFLTFPSNGLEENLPGISFHRHSPQSGQYRSISVMCEG